MVRIKSRWHKSGKEHSFEEIAGALAYAIWKLAMAGVLSMEKADFKTDSLKHRLDIIQEYLAFAVHMVDRLTIDRLDQDERMQFLTEVSKKCAKHLEDNLRDIIGPGEYRGDFISLLNQRMGDYAEFEFTDGTPSFGLKRMFGEHVKAVMNDDDKQWVGQQIIDVEVPDMMKHLKRATMNLFRQ